MCYNLLLVLFFSTIKNEQNNLSISFISSFDLKNPNAYFLDKRHEGEGFLFSCGGPLLYGALSYPLFEPCQFKHLLNLTLKSTNKSIFLSKVCLWPISKMRNTAYISFYSFLEAQGLGQVSPSVINEHHTFNSFSPSMILLFSLHFLF